MLLLEWDRWWESIPVIDAEEQLAAYTARLVADSGWKLDRDDILNRWRAIVDKARRFGTHAAAHPEQAPPEEVVPGALRRTAQRVRAWLAYELASGPKRGAVGWEEGDQQQQK